MHSPGLPCSSKGKNIIPNKGIVFPTNQNKSGSSPLRKETTRTATARSDLPRVAYPSSARASGSIPRVPLFWAIARAATWQPRLRYSQEKARS